MSEQKTVLESYAFVQRLKELPFVEAIYLYGSRAKNNFSPTSDFDLAVVCPRANDDNWLSILSVVAEADTLVGIDVIRYDALLPDHPLKKQIKAYGQVIFERDGSVILKMQSLGDALHRLAEILDKKPEKDVIIYQEAAIKRFEFTLEVFWKTLKKILRAEGIDEVYGPKDALRKAFQNNLISDEKVWIEMLHDRNTLCHIYREADAVEVYARLPDYYLTMNKNYVALQQRYF